MPTHLGFLRAVNIGKRQFKTAELRAVLERAGYAGVETYIQTGNIRIESPLRSRAKLEAELEALFLADRGFEVPTMVFSPAELTALVDGAADVATRALGRQPEYAHYISLLKEPATAQAARAAADLSLPGESVVVHGRAMHLLYDTPYGQAKLPLPKLERILGPATNRSLKVLGEIVERWC